jgi:hypothetical protein
MLENMVLMGMFGATGELRDVNTNLHNWFSPTNLIGVMQSEGMK